ncbi:IS3 family transposase [Arthrobacter humicola]|uniref:IS3 family transposase n=1 Tax=Arthrobacter humicola TaxID=409291 RepID=A0ABN2Z1M1_9MICC
MPASRRRFSQEFKDQLCEEVVSTSKTIKSVADSYGVGAETLRNWLKKYRQEHDTAATEAPLTGSERARLKELERENQELRAATAFLKKAAAYFARDPR